MFEYNIEKELIIYLFYKFETKALLSRAMPTYFILFV